MSFIIFGATGQVGSSVIRNLSSSVESKDIILAMRDPSKDIKDLDKSQFRTVQADLTDPASIKEAVQSTGAKKAFIYLTFGGDMTPTIQALKDGGIELVVFLSSSSIDGNAEDATPDQIIPYAHAQVEIQLKNVFGEKGFIAVRPGSFASNALRFAFDGAKNQARIHKPRDKHDYIAPEDIGLVCANVLLNGAGGDNVVILSGPEFVAPGDAVGIIGDVFGRKIEVIGVSDDEELEKLQRFLPKHIANYLIKADVHEVFERTHEPGKQNFKKYSGGKAPVTFPQWVEDHKVEFEAVLQGKH